MTSILKIYNRFTSEPSLQKPLANSTQNWAFLPK